MYKISSHDFLNYLHRIDYAPAVRPGTCHNLLCLKFVKKHELTTTTIDANYPLITIYPNLTHQFHSDSFQISPFRSKFQTVIFLENFEGRFF